MFGGAASYVVAISAMLFSALSGLVLISAVKHLDPPQRSDPPRRIVTPEKIAV